jgi:hypothetical protein
MFCYDVLQVSLDCLLQRGMLHLLHYQQKVSIVLR